MLGISYVKSGIRRVGEALHSLAESIEQLNSALRSQAHLDGDPVELPVVAARHAGLPAGEPEEVEGNGELPVSTGGKKGRKS